jgi:inorganic triphosphatase YgiF
LDDTASKERELKLEVPDAAWDGLAQALLALGAHPVALHATYFDTDDGKLAKHRIAVRMRREGDAWVQTVKAPGDHAFERLEDNATVPGHAGARRPALDLGRHGDAPAVDALRRALKLGAHEALPALHPVFEVRVRRLAHAVPHGESVVELALDDGELLAGERTERIRELELELREGELADLLTLARQWRERHGLWLRTASKAARGRRLADGVPFAPPLDASAPDCGRGARLGELVAAVLDASLAQVLANAGEVAAGSNDGEHVHQLRVGLRRLRTALRELRPLAREGKALEPVLSAAFGALGQHRDREYVLHHLQPQVEAAGGPPLRLDAADQQVSLQGVVRDGAFQDALLVLLARAEALRGKGGGPVRRRLRPRLEQLFEDVVEDGRRLTALGPRRQHRVRKRLKRLRYLTEFVAPLFPGGRVKAFVAAMKPAQDALGASNDSRVGAAVYARQARRDPRARFGAEWLAAQARMHAADGRKALRRLAKETPFWRK